MGSENDGIRRRQGGPGHLVVPLRPARSAAPALITIALAYAIAGTPAAARPAAAATPIRTLAQRSEPVPAPAGDSPFDAVVIYDRAHAAVAARTVPPFITYTQTVTFSRHGKIRRTERSRIVLRTADGRANIIPIGPAPEDVPAGPAVVKDRPLIFPTTTFGFVRAPGETPSAYEPEAAPAPAPSGPPVIGRVRATTRDYDPAVEGRTSVDSRPAVLLRLVPRRDPEHYRIREMAVDALTYQPLLIAIEVYAHAGPVSSKPVAIAHYAPIDGTWVIVRATIDFVARFGPFAYGGDGRLTIEDVAFPATEPETLFAR